MQPYQTLENFLEAAIQGVVFPRIYLDTNIILDLIEHRNVAVDYLWAEKPESVINILERHIGSLPTP